MRKNWYEVHEKEAGFPYVLTQRHEIVENGEVVGGGNVPIAKFHDKELAEKVGRWILSESDEKGGDGS